MTAPETTNPDGSARGNPVPLIVAAVVALVIAGGLIAMLLSGDDGGSGEVLDEPVVIGEGSAAPTVVTDGGPAPQVDLTYFDGTTGSLADFAGKPVVLNFFAEWCAPCVAEMPDLQAVSEEYDGQVAFLGVNTRDLAERGDAIVEETGVEYQLARDPSGGVFLAFDALAMPTTVFIDADGNVARVWSGRIGADELRQVIEQDLLA